MQGKHVFRGFVETEETCVRETTRPTEQVLGFHAAMRSVKGSWLSRLGWLLVLFVIVLVFAAFMLGTFGGSEVTLLAKDMIRFVVIVGLAAIAGLLVARQAAKRFFTDWMWKVQQWVRRQLKMPHFTRTEEVIRRYRVPVEIELDFERAQPRLQWRRLDSRREMLNERPAEGSEPQLPATVGMDAAGELVLCRGASTAVDYTRHPYDEDRGAVQIRDPATAMSLVVELAAEEVTGIRQFATLPALERTGVRLPPQETAQFVKMIQQTSAALGGEWELPQFEVVELACEES